MPSKQQLQDEIDLLKDRLTRANTDTEEYNRRWKDTQTVSESAQRELRDQVERSRSEGDRVRFVEEARLLDHKEIIRWLVNKDAALKPEISEKKNPATWNGVDPSFFMNPPRN